MNKNFLSPVLRTAFGMTFALLIGNGSYGQISTVAGAGGAGYGGDGSMATAARFNGPSYVARDNSGNLYIADANNSRVRMVNTSGIVTTIAGTGTAGYSGDGGAASSANIHTPAGVAVDRAGNVYISDVADFRIRKINTSGIISTYAGTGTSGYSGDGGAATAAKISPNGIAIDTAGNLLIAEKNNSRIRMVSTSGVITTFAGRSSTGYSGDGGAATAAQLSHPVNVAVDNNNNVYICDQSNTRIRKITSGVINAFAGSGSSGSSGDGGAATAATFNAMVGIAFDNAGSVYIGDAGNNKVRVINTSGVISTYAGTGSAGYSGDGGAATAAQLYTPTGLANDNAGSIYIADMANGRIRKVAGPNHATSFSNGARQALSVCENSSANALDALMAISDSDAGQTETWSVNSSPVHGTLSGFSLTHTSTGGVITPSGLGYAPTSGYSGTDSFRIQISDGITSAITTIVVTVNPLPTAATISGPTSVCEGGAIITLTATGASGAWTATNTHATVIAAGTVTGVTAGVDTIKYTVSNSCGSATAVFTITINPLPTVPSITGSATVVAGSVTTLGNTATGGTWSSSNIAVASVSATGDVTGVTAGTATISYAITNSSGCTGYATMAFTVTPYLSVGSLSASGLGISLYPNPASDNITITSTQARTIAITITDITGAIVYTGNMDGALKTQIGLSYLSNGLYVIKLATDSTSYYEKLEIMK